MLASEAALNAIAAQLGVLAGNQPVRRRVFAWGAVIDSGPYTLTLNADGSSLTGFGAQLIRAELDAYIQKMGVAVRQQNLVEGVSQIGRVLNDNCAVNGTRTVRFRV